MILGIYCRKSVDSKDRDSSSIDDQKQAGINLARSLGMEHKLYIEQTSSGKLELKDRPKMVQMLKDIDQKKPKIQAVFAYDPSRLYRNDDTKIQFLSIIKKREIELYFQSGKFDWNDPTSKLVHNILSATNEFFVDLTSMKIKDTLRRKAKQGKVNGAVLPYGYKANSEKYLVIDEQEAEVVRYIFDGFMEGKTSTQIRNYLIDNEIPTRYNKIGGTKDYVHKERDEVRTTKKSDSRWTNGTILQILRNPVYKGERKWGEEVFDSPIIIDPVKWEKVNQSYLNRNKGSLRGKNTEHKYLLTPMLQCGCGKSLIGRSNKLENYYGCAGKRYKETKCNSKYIPVRVLDELITNIVYGNLYQTVKQSGSGDVVKKREQLEKRIADYDTELASIKRNLNKLDDHLTDGRFTTEQYDRQKKRLSAQTSDLQIKKSNLQEQLSALKGDVNQLEQIENDIIKPMMDKMEYPQHPDSYNPFEPLLLKIFQSTVGRAQPFEEKQKVIRKYVKNIKVDYKKEHKLHEITLSYRLPIEDETYYMDVHTLHAIDSRSRQPVWVNEERYEKHREKVIQETEARLREYQG
jgi:DNA invertase Pin-like site-specific DNA recombinase/uncharacterized coiled-coil protein SlyX